MLTKNINSKLSINWREKAINKVNKPPRNVESDSYWKQDNTAEKKMQKESVTNMKAIDNKAGIINEFSSLYM